MFSAIEKLARGGTLLVTVCKEDDEALRVGVTQVPANSKTEPTLRPLSLVGTAAELDAGFAEAVSIWQAPRKTLAEQARAAASDEEGEAEAPANKPKSGGPKRAAKPQADKQKPAASATAAAGAGGEAAPAPGPDAAAGAGGEAAPAPGADAAAGAGGEAAPAPGADAAAGAGGEAAPAPGADAAAGAGGEAAPAPGAAPTDGAEDVFTLDLF